MNKRNAKSCGWCVPESRDAKTVQGWPWKYWSESAKCLVELHPEYERERIWIICRWRNWLLTIVACSPCTSCSAASPQPWDSRSEPPHLAMLKEWIIMIKLYPRCEHSFKKLNFLSMVILAQNEPPCPLNPEICTHYLISQLISPFGIT